MGKFLKNLFCKSMAFLAVTSLIITSINAPIKADDCAEYGHIPGSGEVVEDPTCTREGEVYYFCAICGEYLYSDSISALGHQNDGGTRTAEPTCTQDGTITYRCSRCGESLHTESIPATGHVRDGGTVLTVASCTQPGITQYKCSKCGTDMGSDNTPALGHVSDNGTVVREPTTTTPGEIEYKCSRCGTVLREEAIPVIGKRDLPAATFATGSLTLNNIPDNSTVKVNGNVVSTSASGSITLNGSFPQAGDYTITVVANKNGSKEASDPQTIHTHKPNAPSHIQTVDAPYNKDTGAIGGVDTSMEFSLQQPLNWITCTNSSQPVTPGIYIVRYKATSTSIASDSVEALIKKATADKPATPTATFDGATHQLRNLSAGMAYSTNGGDTWTKVSNAMVTLSNDAVNQAVSYKSVNVKNIVNGVESDIQTVAVGRVAQPNGVSTTAATSGNNGSIKNVGTDMQYMKDGSNAWIDIGSSTVTGLSKGKYYVRRKATGNLVESNAISVTIDDKHSTSKEGTPSASFNAYNMHIDGVSGCRISFDGGKNWTDKISNSTYVVNESYVNTTHGLIIYRPGNGSTTSDSDRQYISVTKQPTPSGITATSATPTVPGLIVGTDVSMQYRNSNQANWTDVTGNTVAVAAGTYYLRRHGYANALPSDWLTIVIKASTAVEQTSPTKVVPIDNSTAKTDAKIEVVKDTKTETKQDTKTEAKPEEKQENVASETTEETPAAVENNIPAGEKDPISINGEKGWDAIEATFEAATQPVRINLNESTLVPADVFVKASETNTPIILASNEEATWSVLPTDVNIEQVNSLGGINLGIVNDSFNIPESALETVTDTVNDQVVNKTFDIKHDGNFGFKADLTMKINGGIPGQYANLYCYSPYTGQMEFIDSSVISANQEATFAMTHSSSYAIVTSKLAMSQDSVKEVKLETVSDDSADKDVKADTKTKSKAGNVSAVTVGLIIIIIVLIVALAAILLYQRKSYLGKGHKHHK